MALSTISGTTGITDATITSAKLADFAAAVDLNGVELILDADQDTSITADTDDRIDFKIGGGEHLSISADGSANTVIKQMTNAKNIIFQQYDGNKILEINDGNYVAISGAAAGPGELRIYEDTDNGAHYTGFKSGNNTESISYILPLADATTSGYALTSNASGVLSWTAVSANTPTSADGQALGSASLEWSDLFLADGAVINFGADQDVSLTHVADTGLLLSSTDRLQFGDAGTYIFQSADGVLDLVSDTEIELNATTLDINANVEISGTATTTGVHTFTAVPVFPNNTVETADIQDNAITLAKMAGGTDGNIISYDASGDPVAIATGSDGQVLTSAGAGQPPAFEAAAASVGGASGVDFNDNVKARFGTGNDLEIYHDGTDSIIFDSSDLVLQSDSNIWLKRQTGGGATMLKAVVDGTVELYHDNTKKLETSSAGVTVTGTVNATKAVWIADGDVERLLQLTFDSQSHDAQVFMNTNATSSNHWFLRAYRNGSLTGGIKHDDTSTAFHTSSDYRLKENVDYDWDATTRLKQLKPARFNFISDETNTLKDGFIAHEVTSIVPEAISGEKDAMEVETKYTADDVETQGESPTKLVGDAKTYSASRIEPQAIDQSKLVPLLVKTIQELEARITALE